MRRLVTTSALALVALASVVASASAATKTPVITSFSPAQARIGTTLVINGKNFKKGVRNNRIFFSRATDGKTVRARPSKANSTRRMEVVVPPALANFLTTDAAGVAQPTRFQLQVLSGKFSKKTAKSRSPLILAASAPQNNGGGTVGTTPPPPPDCDSDGIPDSTDTDDDNDGLPDDVEKGIHTDPCKKDTDGDGVGDAYEYYASLDLNANPNYAGKRPYPNPLDASDANKDFDGDGMTMKEEYDASVAYGTATTAPLTYSDGNQTSAAPANIGALDLDENGRITDEEKDADNDGLPNWIEMAKKESTPTGTCAFTDSSPVASYGEYVNIFTDCGAGPMPNGNTFTGLLSGTTLTGAPAPPSSLSDTLNYLDPDSDGDGVPDGVDDQDFDGRSNLDEINNSGPNDTDGKLSSPYDPCDPDPDSRVCPTHTSHNP